MMNRDWGKEGNGNEKYLPQSRRKTPRDRRPQRDTKEDWMKKVGK
jgi:hypothetical protein